MPSHTARVCIDIMPASDQSMSEPAYREKWGQAVNSDEKMTLKTQIVLIGTRNLTVKSVADSVSGVNTAVSLETLKQAIMLQCDVMDKLLDFLGKVVDKM
jgi:hypothetical protein